MKITHCKLNHLTNPLGYTLPQLHFSWQVEDARGTKQTAARLVVAADAELTEVLYDRNADDGSPTCEPPD